MDEKELQQLVKGTTSAMYAVAEALQKQEDRAIATQATEIALQKQQELDVEKAQNENATQNLVKSITDQVIAGLKKSTIYGQKENMELNGDETRDETHKDVFYAEGGDEDKQVDAKDTNKTEEIQQTIHAGGSKSLQLMKKEILSELKKHFLKEHEAQYAGNGEDAVEEEVMEEPVEEEMGMDMDVESEGSSEYPMEEEEYDEDTFKMASVVKDLQKQLADLPALVLKQAQELSNAQLLKSGFRKETSNQPQITKAMGLDDADYSIQKSQNSEDFDINKVSFADLYTAKMKRDAGTGTDGLPENFFRA